LVKYGDSYRIVSLPVKELQNYIEKSVKKEPLQLDKATVVVDSSMVDLTRAEIKFDLKDVQETTYTFILHNKIGNEIRFGLNKKDNYFFIDRSKSGDNSFSEGFGNKVSKAPYNSDSKNLSVWLLLDKTSIEIFYNNGETVMTEIFFPQESMNLFSVDPSKKSITIENLEVNQFNFK
jgi:levanase/fructan beta-fructosidase